MPHRPTSKPASSLLPASRLLLAASLVALAALAVACTGGGTPAPGHAAASPAPRTTVPTPDLCDAVDGRAVKAALHSKTARCATSGGPGGFTARFTGVAELGPKPGSARRPATLTVSFRTRYDAETGADRWATLGRAKGARVSLFGVGEEAVFEPRAAPRPQLVARQDDLIVAVALQVAGAPVPQDKLPDHLLEVAKQALAAVRSP
jgi:hypothetical protein